MVCGFALGNPMNLAMVIAVYAAISKELGLPLRFPGKPGAYDRLIEMTDAGLLAKATVWAATDPRCANQAFNINNGDLFRWNEMWPKIARFFDLEVAPPLPMSLDVVMADKEPLWNDMVARHGLAPTAYTDVSSWAFGDFVFALGLRHVRRRLQGAALRLPRLRRHRSDVPRHLRAIFAAARSSPEPLLLVPATKKLDYGPGLGSIPLVAAFAPLAALAVALWSRQLELSRHHPVAAPGE